MNKPMVLNEAGAAQANRSTGRVACAVAHAPPLVTRGGVNLKNKHQGMSDFPEEKIDFVHFGKNHGLHKAIFTPQPHPQSSPFLAITDWLNVTCRYPIHEKFNDFFALFDEHTEKHFVFENVKVGKLHGYDKVLNFSNDLKICYGGERQRNTVLISMSGQSCAVIKSWKKIVSLIKALEGKITRWDGAIDDVQGNTNVRQALKAYRRGKFDVQGQRPSYRMVGDWADSIGKGKTLYIGESRTGKSARIYEKGKQLGDSHSPWVRYEVQYGSVSREIPLEVLLNPGAYVAGAYPYLSFLMGETSRIVSQVQQDQIGYEAGVRHCRLSYGKLIEEMTRREPSCEAIVNKLRRAGRPKWLAKGAGGQHE